MNLIDRYVLRETFASCLIVLGALFLITMTNALASIFGDAAADRVPRDAVAAVFGLTATNAANLIAAMMTMVLVALAACTLPAFRAARVDPLLFLREE